MKKQVKPVLVAQNKEGYSKGDICQRTKTNETFPDEKVGYLHIAEKDYHSPVPDWQAKTLLILDESAEIKEGDKFMVEGSETVHTCRAIESNGDIRSNNGLPYVKDACHKIIASHPCISGTLPISKSFLEEFCKMPDAKVFMGVWESENGLPMVFDGECCLTLEDEEVKEEVEFDIPLLAYKSAMDEVYEKRLSLLNRDIYREGFYNGFKKAQELINSQNH